MINKEEVKHIAQLARIKLSDEEIKKYQKELSLILDYVKELEKIDIKNVPATSHSLESKNVIRQDLPRPSEKSLREKLLEGVPERKGDFIKTQKIFE